MRKFGNYATCQKDFKVTFSKKIELSLEFYFTGEDEIDVDKKTNIMPYEKIIFLFKTQSDFEVFKSFIYNLTPTDMTPEELFLAKKPTFFITGGIGMAELPTYFELPCHYYPHNELQSYSQYTNDGKRIFSTVGYFKPFLVENNYEQLYNLLGNLQKTKETKQGYNLIKKESKIAKYAEEYIRNYYYENMSKIFTQNQTKRLLLPVEDRIFSFLKKSTKGGNKNRKSVKKHSKKSKTIKRKRL